MPTVSVSADLFLKVMDLALLRNSYISRFQNLDYEFEDSF